ncbi:uncharacterized protein BJ171DRAFT_522847 [Polychytrium aggregatum]|uniref:uncharacterized protein n=1 Tax=Polychytrium aggregatum TaxID=110093 RepID=UPI0022FE2DEE|nr:uncharacterized protein BJ171DRAFT_522847 [Polychytrium aggregatum]KAI9197139.1 hypothetical protein BJ171DRAFT_522847 [Polychytrium aggregatum]
MTNRSHTANNSSADVDTAADPPAADPSAASASETHKSSDDASDFDHSLESLQTVLSVVVLRRDRFFLDHPLDSFPPDILPSDLEAERTAWLFKEIETALESFNTAAAQMGLEPAQIGYSGAPAFSQLGSSPPPHPQTQTASSPHPRLFRPSAHQRGRFYLLRGQLFNCLSGYSPQAEQDLSKCLKLNPGASEAWNCLGECFWKKLDLENARRCFEAGLSKARSKELLLSLAQLLRQSGQATDVQKSLQESLVLCKEALASNLDDPLLWNGLGTAYLKLFFSNSLDSSDLKRALSAYNRADSVMGDTINVDLYYNRATLFQYTEQYDKAVQDWRRVEKIDPCMTAGTSRSHDQGISRLSVSWNVNVERITELLRTMAHEIDRIKTSSDLWLDAGKLAGYTSLPAYFSAIKCTKVVTDISQLLEGCNPDAVFVCKIVASVRHNLALPGSFIAIDQSRNVFALSVFNIDRAVFNSNDVLSVALPILSVINAKYEDPTGTGEIPPPELRVEYKTIRIEHPRHVLLNERALRPSQIACTELEIENSVFLAANDVAPTSTALP